MNLQKMERNALAKNLKDSKDDKNTKSCIKNRSQRSQSKSEFVNPEIHHEHQICVLITLSSTFRASCFEMKIERHARYNSDISGNDDANHDHGDGDHHNECVASVKR